MKVAELCQNMWPEVMVEVHTMKAYGGTDM